MRVVAPYAAQAHGSACPAFPDGTGCVWLLLAKGGTKRPVQDVRGNDSAAERLLAARLVVSEQNFAWQDAPCRGRLLWTQKGHLKDGTIE